MLKRLSYTSKQFSESFTYQETTIVKRYSIRNIGLSKTCFLGGTKIVMADDSYKDIEDIVVGDYVKSYDEKNGQIIKGIVTEVFHHSPEEMGEYYLLINDYLSVTPDHLLFTDMGWKKADDIKPGNNLFSKNRLYEIYSIKKIFEKEKTYDFEVDGSHNYFVVMDINILFSQNQ